MAIIDPEHMCDKKVHRRKVCQGGNHHVPAGLVQLRRNEKFSSSGAHFSKVSAGKRNIRKADISRSPAKKLKVHNIK